jgi:arylsulfatase A-like enzyme
MTAWLRLSLVVLTGLVLFSPVAAQDKKPPNLVVIMTDNHGSWTLGCYGNPDIKTPHLDQLARDGILFTQAFANNAVCSPTRASFLTGLMPSQHGVHTYLRAGNLQIGPKAECTIRDYGTLPAILRSLGYICGLVGKWHLGDNLHPQLGFSTWVTTPHGHTLEFYDQDVIENGKIRKEPTYLTQYWTDRGVKFITENKDRPFFLFLTYNGPYGLGKSMQNPPRNEFAELYKGKTLKSYPREKMHPWLFSTKELHNNETVMQRYASEVSAVDAGVGRILAELKKHDLDSNTLVIFLGDQGLAVGQNGLWGMGDHTRPLSAFTHQLQIPLIVRHTGHIPPGQKCERIVTNYDLFPSILHYLGKADRLPKNPPLPGRDLTPLLLGKQIDWDDVAYFDFENVRAIRTPEWNYIERFRQEPNELYHWKDDPDERKNLYGHKEHQAVQKELHDRLHKFFARHSEPRWDLWNGGGSRTHLLTAELFKKKE